MDWNDVQYFLEVARARTLTAAARRLQVEHSTVSRRIERLERSVGAALFDRRRDGYVLSEAGQALLPRAEAMESAWLEAREEVGDGHIAVTGSVRLGAPEVFATRVIVPRLERLLERHPDLALELLLLPQLPSLAAREADLLVTLDPPKGGRYVVTRLVDIRYYLYAAPAYLEQHGPVCSVDALAGHRFVDYVQEYLLSDALRYLDELVGAPRRVVSSTGMLAQYEAIAAGLGIGMLTTYALPPGSPLVRVLPEAVAVRRTLWLAAPIDLLRLRRVRAVWDYLRELAEMEHGKL